MSGNCADRSAASRSAVSANSAIDSYPAAFIGLLEGRNFGKLIVHVAD